MKKYQKSSFLLTMTILLVCSVFVINGFSQVVSQSQKSGKSEQSAILPDGDWSISIFPYELDIYSPVSLFSVSSNNGRAERFDVQNIANKPVNGIKISWSLYKDEDRSKIIRKGNTPLLVFRKELLTGKRGFIKLNVVSFATLSTSLLTKNGLEGDFSIDLRVEEVQFSDGSIWQRQDGQSPDIKAELVPSAAGDCAKQQCKGTPSTEVIGAVTYSCETSAMNQRCQTSGAYSCSNVSCSQPGGGGGGGGSWDEIEIINPY